MRAAALIAWLVAAPAAADPVWGCDGVGYGGAVGAGWADLVLMVPSATGAIEARLTLPEGKLFDGRPVCGDLDGDGVDEIVTIERDVLLGPQIAVYAKTRGRVAASLPPGAPDARLTVLGVGDFASDGKGLVAVIDGGGTVRMLALAAGRMPERGALPGYAPGGGVRDCGGGAELVLGRADGGAADAIRATPQGLAATRIGEVGDIARLVACGGD